MKSVSASKCRQSSPPSVNTANTVVHTAMKPRRAGSARRAVLLLTLLAAAVLLLLREPTKPAEAPPLGAGSATEAPVAGRDAREAAYDKDIAALTALIDSEMVDEEARAQAARRLERMVDEHQCELGVEAALKQAGYAPCFALAQNGALTVMVNTDTLSAAQSATILSLCAAHTEYAVENIRIMTGIPLEA